MSGTTNIVNNCCVLVLTSTASALIHSRECYVTDRCGEGNRDNQLFLHFLIFEALYKQVLYITVGVTHYRYYRLLGLAVFTRDD